MKHDELRVIDGLPFLLAVIVEPFLSATTKGCGL